MFFFGIFLILMLALGAAKYIPPAHPSQAYVFSFALSATALS